uniref:tRNA dimethylallyltransferase n=1 Tax=Haemonchus placei TaxID=6290 RepID=A0A0N4X400_HAEPC
LGVAIAKKYNGEIISADSMQIYKGLDIATNKITKEEAAGIPHHLMSFVDAATARYNIHQFRAEGLKVIEEIKSRGRIPVVVGGTAYYVESLLFEENIIETPGSYKNVMGNISSLLHLQFTLRVEKMKQMGLRKELEDYYDELINRDHFGVLQCIGLKEFIPYLELPKEERSSSKGDMLFEKGCDDVKLHTRQYARRQRNWVNSRFVRRQEAREVPSLKKLDTSNKDTFLASGLNIVEQWMSGCDFKEEVSGFYK